MKKENKVAERIKAIRKVLALKQTNFGKRLNITASSVSEMESGKYNPNFDFVVNIVRVYNVNPNYILFGEGEMFISTKKEEEKVRIEPLIPDSALLVNRDEFYNFLRCLEGSPSLQLKMISDYRIMMVKEGSVVNEELEAYEKKKKGVEKNE